MLDWAYGLHYITIYVAVVQIQCCHFGSAEEYLRPEGLQPVGVEEHRGGVHRDLAGDRGQVPVAALYNVHVPRLKGREMFKLALIEIITNKFNKR